MKCASINFQLTSSPHQLSSLHDHRHHKSHFFRLHQLKQRKPTARQWIGVLNEPAFSLMPISPISFSFIHKSRSISRIIRTDVDAGGRLRGLMGELVKELYPFEDGIRPSGIRSTRTEWAARSRDVDEMQFPRMGCTLVLWTRDNGYIKEFAWYDVGTGSRSFDSFRSSSSQKLMTDPWQLLSSVSVNRTDRLMRVTYRTWTVLIYCTHIKARLLYKKQMQSTRRHDNTL